MPDESKKQNYVSKRDFKEGLNDLKEELKTHMGVLFEKSSEQTALLAEQLQSTNSRVKNVEIRFDRMEDKLDNVEIRFDRMEDKLDVVVDTVGEIKVQLTEINTPRSKLRGIRKV